jgi:hypothetical protein
MSTNKNLFKEAIADAKAVREAALANAKAALEEALTPKLESMLAAKLQEMDEDGDDLEEMDYIQHNSTVISEDDMYEEEELEEDFDLSEILAELEDENENLYEAKEEEDGKSKESIGDMSVEDLKDLIADIIHSELEHEEEETPEDEEAEEEHGGEDGVEMPSEDEEEVDLNELLAELDALDEDEEEYESMQYETKKKAKNKALQASKKELGYKEDKLVDYKDDMKEAIRTIKTLRNELNETNLLNAKLLYVNKIFKAKNLTESQKLKVIASFDKATNVKEAKIVFESLNNAITTPAKKTIKESLGFASKAAGVAPNRTIVESNDVISRMQKLANIIK